MRTPAQPGADRAIAPVRRRRRGDLDVRDIAQGRIYGDLADLVALISPPWEYAAEADHWRAVLREKLGDGRLPILELGVGGGHNLSHLAADVEATAVDLSAAMLDRCRRLNPAATLHQGDMRSIRLQRTFAAVLIHDAVSYMLSEADLAAAFATAAAHLACGGILITSPDRYREDFRPPEIDHATNVVGDREVTWFEYTHDPDPADTTVETVMTCLLRTPEGLRLEHDRHVTGLFPRSTWLRLLRQAGFAVEARVFELAGWPRPYELLVGTRA